MKKILMSVMVLLFCAAITDVKAQQNRLKMYLGYNVNAPLGSFKTDYISNTSFKGVAAEITYAITPKLSLGLGTGFNNYHKKYDRAVYKLDETQSISAVMTNDMDIIPVLAKGILYPMGDKYTAIQPYVSLGAGANLISYRQYLGEFSNADQTSVAFAAQAGAGILIPFNKALNETGFKLGGTYNFSPYNKNGVSNLNTVGVNAGVTFILK